MLRYSMILKMLALVALVIPACREGGDDFRFTVHPADGTVLYKGKPVPRAVVRFHPTDPATVKIPDGKEGMPVVLTTETEEDGRFALSTYLADDGVPAGEYTVTVASGPPGRDLENSDGEPPTTRRSAAAPGKIYRDPSTTPLKATVKPGENHFKFELE